VLFCGCACVVEVVGLQQTCAVIYWAMLKSAMKKEKVIPSLWAEDELLSGDWLPTCVAKEFEEALVAPCRLARERGNGLSVDATGVEIKALLSKHLRTLALSDPWVKIEAAFFYSMIGGRWGFHPAGARGRVLPEGLGQGRPARPRGADRECHEVGALQVRSRRCQERGEDLAHDGRWLVTGRCAEGADELYRGCLLEALTHSVCPTQFVFTFLFLFYSF